MDDTSRRVEELRTDIEETRDEMSETIGAIQDKLRPSHIVAQATDRVKQATMEGVRDMTHSATDTARDAMSTARDAMNSRAIPLAMIGLGAAWLLIDRTSDSRSEPRSWSDRDRPFRYQWEREAAARWRNTSAGHQYSTAADDFGVSAESMATVRDDRERTGTMSRSATGARWRSDSGINRIQHTARTTGNRIERMVRDNPLLVGAGALMLGAAFGMAVPETDVENEWMGDTRDSLVQSAQQMAQDAAAKVQDTAGSLADAAGCIATGGDA
jgi:Protein of unknown function (DUF3618)